MDKFRMIGEYVQRNCGDVAMAVLVVNEMYDDLKDMFDDGFWALPQ